MPDRQVGMVEVVTRIAVHAELLHDALRRQVEVRGEGDDFVESEVGKGVIEPGAGPFRDRRLRTWWV